MKKTLREREIITLLPLQTWKSLLVLDMGEGIDMGLEGEAKLWILFLLVLGFCSFFKHLIISKTIGLKRTTREIKDHMLMLWFQFKYLFVFELYISLCLSISRSFLFFPKQKQQLPLSLSLSLKRTNLLSGWSCNDFPLSNGFFAGKKPSKTTTTKEKKKTVVSFIF